MSRPPAVGGRADAARPRTGRAAGAIGIAEIAALVLLIAGAIVTRARVVEEIPNLLGPGDPGIYFQMGRGVLHHGVPRVDFIHHFLVPRAAIAHIEDYYEPATFDRDVLVDAPAGLTDTPVKQPRSALTTSPPVVRRATARLVSRLAGEFGVRVRRVNRWRSHQRRTSGSVPDGTPGWSSAASTS